MKIIIYIALFITLSLLSYAENIPTAKGITNPIIVDLTNFCYYDSKCVIYEDDIQNSFKKYIENIGFKNLYKLPVYLLTSKIYYKFNVQNILNNYFNKVDLQLNFKIKSFQISINSDDFQFNQKNGTHTMDENKNIKYYVDKKRIVYILPNKKFYDSIGLNELWAKDANNYIFVNDYSDQGKVLLKNHIINGCFNGIHFIINLNIFWYQKIPDINNQDIVFHQVPYP